METKYVPRSMVGAFCRICGRERFTCQNMSQDEIGFYVCKDCLLQSETKLLPPEEFYHYTKRVNLTSY